MSEKRFVRYSARGLPIYEDSEGYKICVIEDCLKRSHNATLCQLHRRDGNDYSKYIESIKKPLNNYTLINDEYYEMTVNNSDSIYKISKEDYEFAKNRNWFALKGARNEYLASKKTVEGKRVNIYYHNLLLKEEIESLYKKKNLAFMPVSDHINGNVYDNRRSNLRVASISENNINKPLQANNESGFVGIGWHTRDKVWTVSISLNNKHHHLGNYYYLRNAVKSRVNAENKYFGEYSYRFRDAEYAKKLDKYLSMPEITEPVLKKRPDNEFKVLGVARTKNNRFRATIYDKSTKKSQYNTFDTFEEAYQWRLDKEIEVYGTHILYRDEMKEKQI